MQADCLFLSLNLCTVRALGRIEFGVFSQLGWSFPDASTLVVPCRFGYRHDSKYIIYIYTYIQMLVFHLSKRMFVASGYDLPEEVMAGKAPTFLDAGSPGALEPWVFPWGKCAKHCRMVPPVISWFINYSDKRVGYSSA